MVVLKTHHLLQLAGGKKDSGGEESATQARGSYLWAEETVGLGSEALKVGLAVHSGLPGAR